MSVRGALRGRRVAVAAAALFLAVVAVLAWGGVLPWLVPALYLAASVGAFAAYALDKAAARNGEWRTKESTLLGLGLLGGWPGALVAQTLLRHKSSKPSFQVAFWLTALLNCGVLAWLTLA
jgi:uncharacterized membrane protein YsdA (DUF1294 family)